MPEQRIVSPHRLRWVKGVCVFRCNLLPALMAKWPGSFTCQCGYTVVERTPYESQHTKLTLEKKILPPLLPGFEPAAFRSRDRRSYQQAIPVHSAPDQDYSGDEREVGVQLAASTAEDSV